VDNVISINNGTLPEGTRVGDHFAFVAPPPINAQVFAVAEQADADMQAALKAYNSSGDFAGIDNNTATATRIGAQREARAHNVHLALFAGALKEVAVRRLELARKHYKNLRLVATIDSLSGKRKVATINSVSLQCQFIAWVKTGSFMPNLDIEKRAAFIEAVNAASALAGINMLNPASLQSINRRFQTDLTFERLNERVEECEETLDLMLQALAQTQGRITPEELYMLNPVDPTATGHDAKLLWWRDWLSSKEGRNAPENVKQAVRIHIGEEYQALATEQSFIAALAKAGTEGQEDKGTGGQGDKGTGGQLASADNPMMDNPMMAEPMAAIQPAMGGT
jgi:hypothetical protein